MADARTAAKAPVERAEAAEQDEGAALQRRRRDAQRAARRALSRPRMRDSLGERIEELARLAGTVADLDEPVDIYGGGIVAELEERVAELLGTEAAAFFPSGTMAQQVALRAWAGRTGNPVVALHPLAHPEVHERDALHTVSGLRTVHPTRAPRLPTAAEVAALEEPFGTLMLELPLRDAGFVLPSWEELVDVVAAARERDAVVHFDGARLWETETHFGKDLREIAALADSVYVSFYKSLEGLGGAVLAGPRQLVDEARAWRHRYGGQIFQQFPTALSALIGLERELPRLREYVARAREVSAALRRGLERSGVSWYRLHPEVPHTHQFQLWLPYAARELDEAGIAQARERSESLFGAWHDQRVPGIAFTEVTVAGAALEWPDEDIEDAVVDFVGRLQKGSRAVGEERG
ncbi:beta-eliminating lyase-related protein [Streptomyces sp. NPDC047046]|uniref:threonine aldolase family protein n=1 Tax=Streptomyces sp. NPDC047046 TaxID=3155378 RepID=UPI0033CE8F1A